MNYHLILMSMNESLIIKNIHIQYITTAIGIVTFFVTLIQFWNDIRVNSAIAFEYKYLGDNIVYGFRYFLNIIGIILLSFFVVAASDIFKVYPQTNIKEQSFIYGIISIMSVITYVILYKFFITSNIDYYYVDKNSGQKLYYRYINQKLNMVYYTMTSNQTDKSYITKTIEEDMDYVKEWEYRKDGISLDNLNDGIDKKSIWTLVLYILIGAGILFYVIFIFHLGFDVLSNLYVFDILKLVLYMQILFLSCIFIPYLYMPLKEILRRSYRVYRKKRGGR